MKQILFFCFFLLVFLDAKADYSRLKLFQVIESTEIAVVGTIVNVGVEYYTVEIEKVLYGDYSAKMISIVKFPDWQDYHRFKTYAAGQRGVFFTNKSNSIGLPFEFKYIGAGNEGEIEIIGDSAILLDRLCRSTKYDLDEMLLAIEDYKSAVGEINMFYQDELKKYYVPFDESLIDSLDFTCPIMSELEKKSTSHKMLIDDKRYDMMVFGMYMGKYGLKDLNFETDVFRDLFLNVENRVEIEVIGYNIDSIDIQSDNCETTKRGKEFFVKPLSGEKTDLFFVNKSNNTIDSITSFECFIKEYIKPTIDVEIFKHLKESSEYPTGHLLIGYNGGYFSSSRFSDVLGFSMDIISKDSVHTYTSVSSRITYEMMNNIRESKEADVFRLYNIRAIDYNGGIFEIQPVEFDLKEKGNDK